MEILGFSKLMGGAWREALYSPLYNLDSFISLARISDTVLNSAGESEPSCPIPDLGRKAFSISLLTVMLAVDFINLCFPYTYWLRILMRRELKYCQVFSFIY